MAFWKRGIAVGLSAISLGVGLLGATPAQAAEDRSQNSGWMYVRHPVTNEVIGKGYFDADANGKPGQERLWVKDLKADGRGALIQVVPVNEDRGPVVRDPNYDNIARYHDDDLWKEGRALEAWVCSYKKGTDTFCSRAHEAVS
jgi:hypothetical protein